MRDRFDDEDVALQRPAYCDIDRRGEEERKEKKNKLGYPAKTPIQHHFPAPCFAVAAYSKHWTEVWPG